MTISKRCDELVLKPCPFCGNAPVLDDFNTSYRSDSAPSWRVMCKGPCAVELFTHGDGSREAAIAAWNTRAIPELSSLQDKIRRLEKAIGKLRAMKTMCESCSQPLYVEIIDEVLDIIARTALLDGEGE